MTEKIHCQLFLLMLMNPVSASETTLMKQFFNVDSRYSDILPSVELLWTRNGSFSLSRCAILCAAESTCLSFFLNNDRCHGYPYRMDDRRKNQSAAVLGMVYAEPKGMLGNLALLKPTSQGSYRVALAGDLTSEYAVDGHRWPGIINPPPLCSVSKSDDPAPFWEVDLQQEYVVHAVAILIISANPISGIKIEVANAYGGGVVCTSNPGPSPIGKTFRELPCNAPSLGQLVRISKTENILTLCEVEVYGTYP